MAVLGGKEGVDVKFWFCGPQKAHPRAEPRLLTYYAWMSAVASWLHVGDIWNQKKDSRVSELEFNVPFQHKYNGGFS